MSIEFSNSLKIYKSYRSTLSSLKKSPEYNRAATRKQRALKQTADKYEVRISEVKSIVHEYDEIHGVTHGHPEPYLDELRFNKEVEEVEAKYSHLPEDFCPVCENNEKIHDPILLPIGKEGNEVRVRANPFVMEIHGVLTPMYSCFGCYIHERHEI